MRMSIRMFLAAMFCVVGTATAEADSFAANLSAAQVTGTSTETGTGVATFFLDASQQTLSYTIQVFGLDLKADASDRTGFSDVTAIHLHNGFAGATGPHVLNIFGVPSEDDADVVIDFDNDIISGVYDDSDAIDPNTGELFDQNSPLTTKLLSNFVDDLQGQQIYVAIHTAGQDGNIAIRGQLTAVPEPSSVVLVLAGVMCCGLRRKR